MRAIWRRRFEWDRRHLLGVLALLLAAGLALWWLVPVRGPLAEQGDDFDPRLDSAVESLASYRGRLEAGLRLQFLEAALLAGRRSEELRSDYRMLEEQLETLFPLMEPELRSALEGELAGLLPDLSRDRRAARQRLARMEELLLPPVGLERQGGVL